jgi:hypothetical protein
VPCRNIGSFRDTDQADITTSKSGIDGAKTSRPPLTNPQIGYYTNNAPLGTLRIDFAFSAWGVFPLHSDEPSVDILKKPCWGHHFSKMRNKKYGSDRRSVLEN